MLEKKVIEVNEATLKKSKFKWKQCLKEKYNFFNFFSEKNPDAEQSAVVFYSAMDAVDEALFQVLPYSLGYEKIRNYALHIAALYGRMLLPQTDIFMESDKRIDPSENNLTLCDMLVKVNTGFLSQQKDVLQAQSDYLGWVIGATLNNAGEESYKEFNKQIQNFDVYIKNGKTAVFNDYYSCSSGPKNTKNNSLPQISFGDIAGYTAVKDYFQKLAKSIKGELPDIYSKVGIPRPCGFLLYGPPGTGKNLLVYAFANELGWQYYELNLEEALDKYVGESEKKVAEFLNRKGVLFIDEFDSFGRKNNNSDSSYQLNITNVIAAKMNDYDEERIIFAATNNVNGIAEKLKRGKRFGKVIEISYPSLEDTEAILRLKLAAAQQKSGNSYLSVDCGRVAEELHKIADEACKNLPFRAGFSGGDIEEVVNETLERNGMELWQGGVLAIPSEEDYIQTARNYNLLIRQS